MSLFHYYKITTFAIFLFCLAKCANIGTQKLSLNKRKALFHNSNLTRIQSGTFYKQLKSLNEEEVIKFFGDTVGIMAGTAAFCAPDSLLSVMDSDRIKTICNCDCKYVHGASGSVTCSMQFAAPTEFTGCECIYQQKDRKNFLNGGEEELEHREGTRQGTLSIKKWIADKKKCVPGGTEEGSWCIDQRCREAFSANPLIFPCNDIHNNGKAYFVFNGQRVYSSDICALDCYYFHGARDVEPFGECVLGNDGLKYCVCLNDSLLIDD